MSTNYATLARGASATSDQVYQTNVANRTIDENNATYCQSFPMHPINWKLTITLDQMRDIQSIRFAQLWGTDAQATQYRIATSANGTDFTTLEDHTVGGGDETYAIEPTQSRYWRFTYLAGGWNVWAIHAIELKGAADIVELPPPFDPDIENWLDDLNTNYVPAVDDWLAAN